MDLEKRSVDFFFPSLEIVKLFFFYHKLLIFAIGVIGKEYPDRILSHCHSLKWK